VASTQICAIPPGSGPAVFSVVQYTWLWVSPLEFYSALEIISSDSGFDGFETFIVPNSPELLAILLPDELQSCFSGGTITLPPPNEVPVFYIANAVDFSPLVNISILTSVSSTNPITLLVTPLPYIDWALRELEFIEKEYFFDENYRPRIVFSLYMPLYNSTTENLFLSFLNGLIAATASAGLPNWAGALSVFANTSAFSTQYSFQIPRGSPMVNVYFYAGGNTEESTYETCFTNGTCIPTPASLWKQTADLKYGLIQSFYNQALAAFPQAKIYPQGHLPYGYTWQRHYGSDWSTVVANKQTYDPKHILGAGIHMF